MAEEQPKAEVDEELLRKVEEQLRELKVSDVLIQTAYTVSSLGWHKLSSTDRDLEQAKLAIESLRARRCKAGHGPDGREHAARLRKRARGTGERRELA